MSITTETPDRSAGMLRNIILGYLLLTLFFSGLVLLLVLLPLVLLPFWAVHRGLSRISPLPPED